MQVNASRFLVTGASSVVGRAVVETFGARGARLAIAGSSAELERELAPKAGAGAVFRALDLTSEADARAALDELRQRCGVLNGLINCIDCAAQPSGAHGMQGIELLSYLVQSQLVGTFNMMRAAAAAMESNSMAGSSERGVIVNVVAPVAATAGASAIARAGNAACSAALFSVSLAIARELEATGIRVVTIAVSKSHRPTVAAFPSYPAGPLSKRALSRRRLTTPADYASLVKQLIEVDAPARQDIRSDRVSLRELEVLRLLAHDEYGPN